MQQRTGKVTAYFAVQGTLKLHSVCVYVCVVLCVRFLLPGPMRLCCVYVLVSGLCWMTLCMCNRIDAGSDLLFYPLTVHMTCACCTTAATAHI